MEMSESAASSYPTAWEHITTPTRSIYKPLNYRYLRIQTHSGGPNGIHLRADSSVCLTQSEDVCWTTCHLSFSDILHPQYKPDLKHWGPWTGWSVASESKPSEAKVSPVIHILLLRVAFCLHRDYDVCTMYIWCTQHVSPRPNNFTGSSSLLH